MVGCCWGCWGRRSAAADAPGAFSSAASSEASLTFDALCSGARDGGEEGRSAQRSTVRAAHECGVSTLGAAYAYASQDSVGVRWRPARPEGPTSQPKECHQAADRL